MSEGKQDENQAAYLTARGMLILASKDMIASAAAVVFFVLLARYLPNVADLGFLIGLQTLIMMFIILSGLGLPSSATRFISTYIGAGQKDRAAGLYPLVLFMTIFLSAAFSILLFLISPSLSILLFHNTEYTQLIQLTSVDVFLYSVINTAIFLLYASKDFRKIALISIFNSLLKYSLSFILLISGLGLYGIILGLIVGDAIALCLFIYSLMPNIRGQKGWLRSSFSELRPLLKFSFPLYGSTILNFLSSRVDVYLLMLLSTLYAVGIYSPAVYIANTFLVLLVAMDQALLPATARTFGKSGTISFKYSARYASHYLFLFYFPLGFAIAASAPALITIIMGDQFEESYIPFSLVVIAITLTSLGVVFNNLIRSAGHSEALLKAELISLTVQIPISVVTIPLLGIIGAALGRVFARFVYFVYSSYRANKLGAFDYDKNALKNGLSASLVVAFVIVVIGNQNPQPYYLLFSYIMAILSYLGFLRVTRAIDEKDIEFIDSVFLGRLKLVTKLLAKIAIQ
jgi:O-antigen/teichoic acid export membrane protein